MNAQVTYQIQPEVLIFMRKYSWMNEDEIARKMPWSPLAGGFLSGKYTRNQKIGCDQCFDSRVPRMDG